MTSFNNINLLQVQNVIQTGEAERLDWNYARSGVCIEEGKVKGIKIVSIGNKMLWGDRISLANETSPASIEYHISPEHFERMVSALERTRGQTIYVLFLAKGENKPSYAYVKYERLVNPNAYTTYAARYFRFTFV
jgi:hypothetical protein